ncbi:MAG: ATP-dependent DNA helicase RecQ [Treponema sp.]|nr:ATP-dependent DNA helicase RecQ [Treponema sp.]
MEELIKIDEDDSIYEDDPVAKAAYKNFGIRYMFPWQRMVVANILEAYENLKNEQTLQTQDDAFCKGRQIVLLPTGAGKSLCFQVPALLLDGPTLVIYPLLALMTDQQRRMEEGSLRSVMFRGGQTAKERQENFRKLKEGAKIIIANPEVLKNEGLVQQLKQVGICHVAIDEAHCVSEWGDSFRPSYLELGKVLKQLEVPVITAFTATASPPVLSRVAEILFDGQAHIVRSESDRPNIHYYVRKAAVKKKEALYLAATEQRPMIIFCGTRGKSEDMARELNFCFGPGTAQFYHAGLEKEEKEEVEQWFYKSRDGVLCATCAYGMGVDKKDIKTVVHLEASATAEAYIQEAGRGGRDGSIAKAILLWSLQDSMDYSVYKPGSREAALRDFAETSSCRRQVLLDALGAEQAVCSGCDICQGIKYESCDWELAYRLIKKSRNFYTKDDAQEEHAQRMNQVFHKALGLKVWNHNDSVETFSQLIKSGKIKTDRFLWRNKLSAVRNCEPKARQSTNP